MGGGGLAGGGLAGVSEYFTMFFSVGRGEGG